MRLELEITGGFTGPAGTQRIGVDIERLPAERGRRLRSALDCLPESAWGASFMAPHPTYADFRYMLRQIEGDAWKIVIFHLHQGPAELSEIAQQLIDIHDEGKSD